jgi:hypothetical protein
MNRNPLRFTCRVGITCAAEDKKNEKIVQQIFDELPVP